MTRKRICGLAVAVILIAGCDHHKGPSQAQDEAGSAAVAQDDSDVTGLPPGAADASGKYPRAALVALPTPTPTPAAVADAPTESSRPEAQAPPPEPTPTPTPAAVTETIASASPQPAVTPSPATSQGDDAMPQQEAKPDHPAGAATSQSASDESQEQVVVLQTSMGSMVIELDDKAAPKTCENFRKLVSNGFYDHTTFHRVIPHFIIQGGDPNSRGDDRSSYGQGGPGYTIPAEIRLGHNSGAVAMARLPDSVNPQRESNGSQFYICLVPCPTLDDNYTVFGHVIKGMDVAAKIAEQPRDAKDNPLNRIEMEASLEPKDKALTDASSGN